MVLILLSSIVAPLSPSFPPSPSQKTYPSSPRTPSTSSPSFFAILSPIFTSSDDLSTPTSPTLRDISTKNIPQQTAPPWLLAPQPSLQPSPLREVSNTFKRLPELPQSTAGDVPTLRRTRACSRAQLDVAVSGNTICEKKPPSPPQIKRIQTEPVPRAHIKPTPSPLRAETLSSSLDIHSTALSIVPILQLRPPSREIDGITTMEDRLIEEGRRLSVAMMGVDVDVGCPIPNVIEEKDKEVMDVLIAIAIDRSTEQRITPVDDTDVLMQKKAKGKIQRTRAGPLGRLASVLGK